MSYETGAIKYIFNVLLTIPGFISMYIFGGSILSILRGLAEGIGSLFSGDSLIEAVINSTLTYFLTEYLPPTSAVDVVFQAILGATIAGILWYSAVPKRGR